MVLIIPVLVFEDVFGMAFLHQKIILISPELVIIFPRLAKFFRALMLPLIKFMKNKVGLDAIILGKVNGFIQTAGDWQLINKTIF